MNANLPYETDPAWDWGELELIRPAIERAARERVGRSHTTPATIIPILREHGAYSYEAERAVRTHVGAALSVPAMPREIAEQVQAIDDRIDTFERERPPFGMTYAVAVAIARRGNHPRRALAESYLGLLRQRDALTAPYSREDAERRAVDRWYRSVSKELDLWLGRVAERIIAQRGPTWTGVEIRQLRQRLGGISQAELSKRIQAVAPGVVANVATISNWENGKHAPSAPARAALDALDRQNE